MRPIVSILTKAGCMGALALCWLATDAVAQEKISLQKAVDLALQNNLSIKQTLNNQLFDEATYKQSKNNQLPNLNGSIQASENFGRALDVTTYQYTSNRSVFALNPSLSAQVVLFQGGLLRDQILQNKLQLDVDRSQTAKAKNDLILNVVVQYLTILTNMDLVTAAKQQIEITKLTLDRTNKTVKAGNQTLADLSQAQAGQSTAELNLTNAENQLALSILTLKQYMEMPPSTEIVIERPDISKINDVKTAFNADEVVNAAINVNPDVKLAMDQQAVSQQGIRIAKAGYYPTLSLFSSLTSNYSDVNKLKQVGLTDPYTIEIGRLKNNPSEFVITETRSAVMAPYYFNEKLRDNFAQAVGVGLQIPIFNRWSVHTNVKKAQIAYENARIATEIAKRTLTKTINQAVLDARAAERQYQSAQQTFQANKDAFRVIRLRYEQGLENSLNFNTSQTNLNKSEFDMIQARYNMIFRAKVIDYYLGNPINL